MPRTTKIILEPEYKAMLLHKGNGPIWENFYKIELEEFCKYARELLLDREEKINRTISEIDRFIEIINQQPSGNDEYLLRKLNSYKYLLRGK